MAAQLNGLLVILKERRNGSEVLEGFNIQLSRQSSPSHGSRFKRALLVGQYSGNFDLLVFDCYIIRREAFLRFSESKVCLCILQ
mmetsp:Transcript_1174/g.2831  ORF Transcript_1174/g.2831 Transcript_1174/m.2831 type:complete len:84 (+) Transcript_1174:1575-1826(+)